MNASADSEHIASNNSGGETRDNAGTENSNRFASLSFPDPPPLNNKRRIKPPKSSLLLICFIIPLLAGCEDYQQQRSLKLEQQRDEAQVRSALLQKQVQELTAESAAAKQQIKTLQKLGDKRLDLLFHVVGIDINKHSGGVDTDQKPGHEVVRIFLSPRDSAGSVIKAAGDVKIALYDLAAPEGKTLVAACDFPVTEISKHWTSGFMTYHYRLDCKLPDSLKHDKLTAYVTFTDYLTGKTFTGQKTVTVILPQNNK